MSWPTHLAARLKLVLQPTAVQPTGQTPADTDLVQQAQTALGLFLGLSDANALALACTVLAHRQTLLAAHRQATRLAVPPGPHSGTGPLDGSSISLTSALAQGSCLLALPCHRPALQWLDCLLQADVAPVVLVDSPALRPLLAALPLPANTWRCCSPTDVIQQVKAGRDGAAPATLYVSVPALHAAGAGTSAQVRFLGQTLRWSLLEPLLCLQGLKTLLTLAPPGMPPVTHGSDRQPLALVSRTTQQPNPGSGGDSPGAILAWLVGHLEASARSQPDLTLCWPQLYRASAAFQAISRSNRLKQVAAFFDAWQAAGGGLQQQTHAHVAARLSVLRSTV